MQSHVKHACGRGETSLQRSGWCMIQEVVSASDVCCERGFHLLEVIIKTLQQQAQCALIQTIVLTKKYIH